VANHIKPRFSHTASPNLSNTHSVYHKPKGKTSKVIKITPHKVVISDKKRHCKKAMPLSSVQTNLKSKIDEGVESLTKSQPILPSKKREGKTDAIPGTQARRRREFT
jgi:hypothetical protein